MRHATLLVLPAALALAACQPQSTADQAATPAADPPPAEEAVAAPAEPAPAPAAARASLAPTEGSSVAGKVEFTAVDGGIRVTGEITGLPAGGQHGFHVHENGDCSAPDGTSAGGHFNPASSAHGRVGEGEHHAGDSDNLSANDQGVAAVDNLLRGATLGDGAPTDIVGRAMIVHADPDDYATQPTGNAGARLACGVIEAR